MTPAILFNRISNNIIQLYLYFIFQTIMSDKIAGSIPFDHPKRSYPVLFSLETPQRIEELQDSYRVSNPDQMPQHHRTEEFDSNDVNLTSYKSNKLNNLALTSGFNQRNRNLQRNMIIPRFGSNHHQEDMRVGGYHKEVRSSVFISHKKMSGVQNLAHHPATYRKNRYDSLDPMDIMKSQELSHIMSEPNDNVFQKMVKNIKNAKQNEIKSLASERSNMKLKTLTGQKSQSLYKQRGSRISRDAHGPLTHRVAKVQKEPDPSHHQPESQNQTLDADTTVGPHHSNSKDTMYSQGAEDYRQSYVDYKNVHILSQPLQTRQQIQNFHKNPGNQGANQSGIFSSQNASNLGMLSNIEASRQATQVDKSLDQHPTNITGSNISDHQQVRHPIGGDHRSQLFNSLDKNSAGVDRSELQVPMSTNNLSIPPLIKSSQDIKSSKNYQSSVDATSEATGHINVHNHQVVNKFHQMHLEEEFISEANKAKVSCYGLPQIAGPITGKSSNKTGAYTNTTIQNNGIKSNVTQYSTDDNFRMIKQRQKLNMEAFSDAFSFGGGLTSNQNVSSRAVLKPMSPPAGSIVSPDLNQMRDSAGFASHFAPPQFPNLKIKKPKFATGSIISELESTGLIGSMNQVKNSNNSFNTKFKGCSSNFKSPHQKKLTVLVNAGNQQKSEKYSKKVRALNISKEDLENEPDIKSGSPEQLTNYEWNTSHRGGNLALPEKSIVSGSHSINDSKSNIGSRLSIGAPQIKSPRLSQLKPREINISGPKSITIHSQEGNSAYPKDKSALLSNKGGLGTHLGTAEKGGESPILEEEEEVDEITGLRQSQYTFKEGFLSMVEKLDRMKQQRDDNSIIDQSITEISESLGIDIDQLSADLHTYVNKRTLAEAAHKGNIAEADDCVILKKAMAFLRGASREEFLNLEIVHKPVHAQCNHLATEEDHEREYIQEYHRFLKFVNYLRQMQNNKQKIPRELIIARITKDIKTMKSLTAKEKQLFKDEESVRKILFHPMLQIVTTMEEISGLKKIQDLDNKRKHNPGTNSISSKGNIELTYGAKGIIERIAEDIINEGVAKTNMIKSKKPSKSLHKKDAIQTDVEKNASKIHEITEEFRIACVKQHQEDRIKNCMQRERPLLNCDPDKMDSDILEQRGHVIFKIDEMISESMGRMIDILLKEAKKFEQIDKERMKTQRKSILNGMALGDQIVEETSDDQNLVAEQRKQNIFGAFQKFNMQDIDQFKFAPKFKEENKMIFGELGSYQKFYKQAKLEIQGYNAAPNQESIFYKECEAAKLLPQPIYKFIQNNTLRVQGQKLGGGYIKPLARYIQNMNEKQKHLHLIKIHLDDCGMTDEDCADLLHGCMTSQLGFALESLTIARNEVGEKTIEKICQCLEMCDQVGTTKCLRELCLSNLLMKNMNHMRHLFKKLESYGDQLSSLRFQAINLNDPDIVDSICSNLRNSTCLHTLEVSNCFLQITQLMEIVDALDGCQQLRVLDLSDNMVSDLKDESQIRQCLFLQKLGTYLTSPSSTLYSLNLQGLFLGRKLLYLIDKIKVNQNLMQVNLTKNELNLIDEQQVMEILRADVDDNQNSDEIFVEKPMESFLEKFDPDFLIKLNRYKIEHLRDEFTIKYSKNKKKKVPEKVEKVEEQQKNEGEKDDKKEAQLMVNSIVNTGILKDLRLNKNIRMQLSQNARLGEVNVSTSLTRIDPETISGSQVDELLLRRPIGFSEFIYPEFGTNLLEHFDYDKQNRWMAIKRNISSSSWMYDILELQYLLIYVDTDKIQNEFEEVKDPETIKLLTDQYGLNSYAENHSCEKCRNNPTKEEYQRKDLNQPIVFGSFSDWRAFQMLRTYQFACILGASSTLEERQCLTNFVFDDVNCNLSDNFKGIYPQVYPIITNVTALHNAHVVGKVPLNPKEQKSPDRSTFIYSCLCPPGKHSVFVFNPTNNTFHKKIIVVDPQDKQLFNRKSLIDQEQNEASKLADKKSKPMSSFQYFVDVVSVQGGKVKQMSQRDMVESFIIDTDPSRLPLKDLFKQGEEGQSKTVETLNTLKKYYKELVMIYKQLHSESKRTVDFDGHGRPIKKETYPLISFEHLRHFCEQIGLCPGKKLDHTIIVPKKRKEQIDPQGVDSIFEGMNRAKFLYFLAWVSVERECSLDSLIKKYLLPLLTNSEDVQNPIEQRMKEIKSLLNSFNKGHIRHFCKKFARFQGNINPKDLYNHIHLKAGVFISEFNFLKCYALSKKLIPFESLDQTRSYFNLEPDELIETIFRVVEHVYDPNNYDTAQCEIPKHIAAMMEEPIQVQFRHNIETILNTPIKEGDHPNVTLIEQEELQNIDDMDIMEQYLPPNCDSKMIAQVEKEYEHMCEVRRQVREKKLQKLADEKAAVNM